MTCTTKHRTNKTRAQCEWPWAERIWGSGPWAVVARCNRTTVSLHPTRDDAEQAKAQLDLLGCGGRCRRAHRIVNLHWPHEPGRKRR